MEQQLIKYLSEREYHAEKISETQTMTPDFKVYRPGELLLMELKSPELILDTKTGIFKFSTTHSKILKFIHKAVKQFFSYDPEHKSPWVIVFTPTHFQLSWKKFTDTLQGGVVFDNKLSPDFTQTRAFEAAQDDIYQIDVYLWLQTNDEHKKIYQATIVKNYKSKFTREIEKFSKQLRTKPVSSMDLEFVLT